MKRVIGFLALVALAEAAGFYSLNDLDRLQFGVNDGSISRQEFRTPGGVVRGTYTYTDGDGTPKTITYGTEGGDLMPKEESRGDDASQENQDTDSEAVDAPKEEAATTPPELPQPVPYTPEVAAARAAHFAARDQAIYLQQLTAGQELLSHSSYSPFFKEYYGAAKHFRDVNPFYFL